MVPNKPEPPPPQAGLPTTPLAQPLKWGKASLRLGGRCPIWDRLPHSKHGQCAQNYQSLVTAAAFWLPWIFGMYLFLIFIILCWENHTILIEAGHRYGWSISNIICMLEGKRRCVLSRIGLCKCGQCPCLLPPRGMHCLKPPSGPTHLQYLHTKKRSKKEFSLKVGWHVQIHG